MPPCTSLQTTPSLLPPVTPALTFAGVQQTSSKTSPPQKKLSHVSYLPKAGYIKALVQEFRTISAEGQACGRFGGSAFRLVNKCFLLYQTSHKTPSRISLSISMSILGLSWLISVRLLYFIAQAHRPFCLFHRSSSDALQLITVVLCFHFRFSLQAPGLASEFRTRGRWSGDTSYHPPRSDWLQRLTRHSCDCFLQRKLSSPTWASVLWNGATPCPMSPVLSARANHGVSRTPCRNAQANRGVWIVRRRDQDWRLLFFFLRRQGPDTEDKWRTKVRISPRCCNSFTHRKVWPHF